MTKKLTYYLSLASKPPALRTPKKFVKLCKDREEVAAEVLNGTYHLRFGEAGGNAQAVAPVPVVKPPPDLVLKNGRCDLMVIDRVNRGEPV